MGLANIAATNMEHLCNCSAHGYDQQDRWGKQWLGSCYVTCEGHTSEFYKGDRDCSSAVIDAWQEALKGTAYEGCLSGATYTGNMRSVFVNSGLFEWHDMNFVAQRGDIYLNEANHTAMCTSPNPDLLAEFSISETGGIYGEDGDQTGTESYIHGYYDYPWNGILHYNGKADGSQPTPTPEPTSDKWLQAYTGQWWSKYYGGVTSEGDDFCGDDCEIYGLRCSHPIQVHVIGGDWLSWVDGTSPEGDDFAGEDLYKKMAIDAIRVKGMDVRVMSQGQSGYWKWLSEETEDDYAGQLGSPIVRVQLR